MSTNHCAKTTFCEFVLVSLTFGSCNSPTDTFPFTYHPSNSPGMCVVDNLQRLRFGNSQPPEKFTGPTSSQEIIKHKSTFKFKFTLRTRYEVNGIYIAKCSYPFQLTVEHNVKFLSLIGYKLVTSYEVFG